MLLASMTILLSHNWIDGAAACALRRSVEVHTWHGIEGDFDYDHEVINPEEFEAANLLLTSTHLPEVGVPF